MSDSSQQGLAQGLLDSSQQRLAPAVVEEIQSEKAVTRAKPSGDLFEVQGYGPMKDDTPIRV